jgi:hypothetical protein
MSETARQQIEDLKAFAERIRIAGEAFENLRKGYTQAVTEKVELESCLRLAMVALTEFRVGVAFVTEMRRGSENAFVKAIKLSDELHHSVRANNLSLFISVPTVGPGNTEKP